MATFRRAVLLALCLSALEATVAGSALAATGAAASAQMLSALRSKVPLNPIGLTADPYAARSAGAPRLPPAGTVCGVRFTGDQVHYDLGTFTSKAAAASAGYAVTHYGGCGTCSTLQDLAVYLEKPDLTAPVRRCGVALEEAKVLACLKELGFSPACAWTWLYNIQNTRRQCLSVCAWSWIEGEESTQSGGHLNSCLQCDEDRSGPVFKATAGRTRRNSGIHSSIPRPDDEIAPVVHDYVPGVPR
ncbi:MAG: hypothetical protein JSR36_13105 [Proteobacteria bacterium]|nr:hypothetical protein [Pseudomonadota bacterium]